MNGKCSLSAYHGGGAIKGHKRGLVFFDCPKYKNFGMPKNREEIFMKTAQSAKNHHVGGTVSLALVTLTKMPGSKKLST